MGISQTPQAIVPASVGGMDLLNAGGTTLSGASVSITSIPATYNYLKLLIVEPRLANDGQYISMRFNNDSGSNRYVTKSIAASDSSNFAFDSTSLLASNDLDNGTSNSYLTIDIYGYANSTTWKYAFSQGVQNNQTTSTNVNGCFRTLYYNQTAAITEINLFPSSGNWTSGTVYVYGVK